MSGGTYQIKLPWTTVWSETTANAFIPATTFMDAADIALIRGSMEVRAHTGELRVALAYEVAQVDSSPVTSATFTAWVTTNTFASPTDGFTNVASVAGAKRLFRLGYYADLATGTSLALARVQGTIDIGRR